MPGPADFDATVEAAEQGLRVNPYSPDLYVDAISMAHFFQGHYEDCLSYVAQIGEQHPETWAWNAACYAHLGDEAAAPIIRKALAKEREVEAFLRDYPGLWAGDPKAGPADYIQWILNVSNPFARDEDRERLAEGLRRAGLPA